MIEIAVVGNAATGEWVARQEQKFGFEGLMCRFIFGTQALHSIPNPDLWLVDLDAMTPNELESLFTIGGLAGKPWGVMANSFSLELTHNVLLMGSVRCFSKPVTPRVLSESCRVLGIGVPPCTGRVAVFEDRETVYLGIAEALGVAGLAGDRLVDIQSAVALLRQDPPDGIVLSHYPEELTIRTVITLLRSFPEINAVPVFMLKGEAERGELLQALNTFVDVVYVSSVDELADTVTFRLSRSSTVSVVRHRLYEKLYDYEQERRALHLHAIVSKTDRTGRIIEVNDQFCEISGYSSDELIGKSHRILKSGNHSPEFYHDLWKTVGQGSVWRGEICNEAKDGSHYWVSSTIVPYLDQSGRPYQYIAIRKDITHVKNAEALIRQQGELAALVGEAAANLLNVAWQDGVDGLRSALSPLCDFLKMEGIALELHQDHPFLHYWIRSSPAVGGLPALWIKTSGTSEGDPVPSRRPPIESPLIINHAQIGTVALHGSTSRTSETFLHRGLAGLLANILVGALARWQREYEHEQGRERLQMAQKYSGIGTWEWNLINDELIWTEQIPLLLGYPPGDLQTSYDNFISAVHPEDRDKVETAIRRTIEDDHPYRVEHRVLWADGQIRWLLEMGDITRDEEGNAVRMLGVVQDITEIREADLRLANQATLLNMLHDSLTAFVLEGRFRSTLNTMLDNLIDLTSSELGYLTEVFYDHRDNPFLRIQAISVKGWDALPSDMFSRVMNADSVEFKGLEDLLGACVRERKPVVVDEAEDNISFGRLPSGHPEIRAFLGVPIFIGSELVGAFALANRKEGYSDGLVEFLRPFSATYGIIINSQRMRDAKEMNRKNLIRAKDHADKANQAKSEFLSSMSHELRTPLNAILGFEQLLESDKNLNEEQLDNVKEILSASRHLLALINGILDLSKIESGNLELALEIIPVAEIIEETLTLVRHLAQSRDMVIRTDNIEGLQVTGDWVRLKQALLNLISNAIKYSRAPGDVLISASQRGEHWLDIRVSDSGPGIEPSRISELFQPFNRLGAERSNIEGTGIGLALTRSLMNLMGGSVGVESQVGKGSTFWLRVPSASYGEGNNTSESLVTQDQNLPGVGNGEEGGSTKTVLYIEDNPASLKLVSRIFHRYLHATLLTATSGKKGLEMTTSEKPDIVLLDINLPDTDGYDVLRQLKVSRQTAAVPVVALTANAMHSDLLRGKKAGFDDYLIKPIKIDELLGVLKKYLR